jgi:O-antigen ligase
MSRFKNIIFHLFSVYLFLTPLLPLKVKVLNKNIPPADALLLLIFMLYFIYIILFRENREKILYNIKSFIIDKFNMAVIVLLIVMAISITYAGSKGVAMKETFRLATFIVILYIVHTEYHSENWRLKIIKVCLLSAAAVSIYGIFQYITGYRLEPRFIDKTLNTKRIVSTLDNPNTLVAYLILFLFPSVTVVVKVKDVKAKILYSMLALLFIINIFMTGSRSALVGMAVSVVVLVVMVSWRYIVFFGAAGLLALLFKPINTRIFAVFDATLNTSRIKIWGLGMKMVQNNPILGVGNGNFVTNYNDYTKRYPHLKYEYYKDFPSHNSYIKVWSELGILGILSFLVVVILSIRKVYDYVKNSSNERVKAFYLGFLCSLCGFYVMNFFDNLLFVPKIALYFWVFLAIRKTA